MSLWQVSDTATRDLMIAYYKRLQAGEGRTAALRQVQLEMLRNNARSHPYYWASFIQSGAWTNLEGKQVSPPSFDLTVSFALRIPELRPIKRLPAPIHK